MLINQSNPIIKRKNPTMKAINGIGTLGWDPWDEICGSCGMGSVEPGILGPMDLRAPKRAKLSTCK